MARKKMIQGELLEKSLAGSRKSPRETKLVQRMLDKGLHNWTIVISGLVENQENK